MNQQHRQHSTGLLSLENQVDRLVDGELEESARRALLRQLDSEPGGWRFCALAFLQAQCWRESMTPAMENQAIQSAPHRLSPRRAPSPWRSVARVSGLAASLAVSFAVGWMVRAGSPMRANDAVMANIAPEPSGQAEPPQPLDANLQTRLETTPEISTGPAQALEPLVKRWEQRGYQAEAQTRRASVKLLDGRRVEIPVHEVRLKYVRDRTY
jgi:hypothetical protein